MSITFCKKRDIASYNPGDIPDFGYNLLTNSENFIADVTTKKAPLIHYNAIPDNEALSKMLNEYFFSPSEKHIDIFCNSADIVFDLKKETVIDNIIFTSFNHGTQNYSVGEFGIFASDTLDNLFDNENEIAHDEGAVNWKIGGRRNGVDWIFDTKGSCRFIGFRVYKANATDEIIRPQFFGAYSDEFSKSYLMSKSKILKFATNNLLSGMEPKSITDGKCYIDDKFYILKANDTLTFEVSNVKTISNVSVITADESEFEIEGNVFRSVDIGNGRQFSELKTTLSSNKFTIKASCDTKLYGIFADSDYKEISVDFSDVITDNYIGIGANVLPMGFMPEAMEDGFNKVYWELEKRRISLTRPHAVRFWFQPDWLCETYEQYKNGEYDFECQKLQSVYKYLDIFREAGTEIELNFGWKVSKHAQSWFSFEGTTFRNSAPRELDLFAKCCGATFKELIDNRGYTNIKYLSFYNENNYGDDSPTFGEFLTIGEKRITYYDKMVRMCRKELDDLGLGHIDIWAAESNGTDEQLIEWLEYFDKNCSDVVDMHTLHRYLRNVQDADELIKLLNSSTKNIPTMITECGQYKTYGDRSDTQNYIQYFNQLANGGVRGMLVWCLTGIRITDPLGFTIRDFFSMWDAVNYRNAINNVGETFYEWAMLCRYIPNHSSVVKSKMLYGTNGTYSAFKVGEDDYTVVVEFNKSDTERQLKVNFDRNINKKMYRHVYTFPHARNGNAIIPPVSKELFATDSISDTVTGDYCAVVYTTLPPVHQIELGNSEIHLNPDETIHISAQNIDGFGDIAWEIAESSADSFILSSKGMTISAKETAEIGDMCAIKAYSVNNPNVYSIAIVKVR